jgi:hypothetical protein
LIAFKNTLLSIGSDAFQTDTESDQVVEVFFNLFKMFPVRKPDELCIPILIVLVTEQAEAFEIGGIHPEVYLFPFDDFC